MGQPVETPLVIGLVANEPSGDQLGAMLIRAIRALRPDVRCIGIAGSRMQAAGCQTLFDMEHLSVMGLTEVLGHLPELLRLRRQIAEYFAAHPPAVFIGIDAPDFNLGLETWLRARGIKTVHLVSPTVWAWRAGRINKIRQAADRLLCLFPFEEDFLRQHGVPAFYVGHPLADVIPLEVEQTQARAELGLPPDTPVIALLPGSRLSELSRLAQPFIETARLCLASRPELRFVVPLVNARLRDYFAAELQRLDPRLPVTLLDGQSHTAIAAADAVLTASGTATLETLLLKRPMVVAYRLHPLSYYLVKWLRLIKIPYVAMANLLVGKALAPEFLQEDCRPERMAPALLAYLDHPEQVGAIQAEYRRVHERLRCDAAATAAQRILELVGT
ncbi:lipid-A-disaccharide synthase [Caldichromatium japonicum]|uniref:Lipid-A-disaccharide synthase n=1 Tax=Caldichromatium japonicum TaxID=2699430 RepID=A0A6G7VBA9_9GAMM|nr:lipid-A-disaccharide synthase [Caldichromatium japonicum]QIK37301.1 lipid-A-disaccharide synthase [Caldichromatium japonicum]